MLIRIFKFLGAGVSFYCFAKMGLFQTPFWLLPLFYTIYLFVFKHNSNIEGSPGLIAMNIAMFCRYVVVPFIYYVSESTAHCAHDLFYLNEALILMLYEQFCVFFAIEITGRKRLLRKKRAVTNITYNIEKTNKNSEEYFFFVISLIVFLSLTILYKDLISGYQVFSSGNFENFSDLRDEFGSKSLSENIFSIVWQMLSIWVYIYAVKFEQRCYIQDGRSKHLWRAIAYSFILIFLSFIDQTGLSRWYTIINASTAIACLYKFFFNNRKKILFTMGSPIVILILYATIIKNGGFVLGDSDMMESIAAVFLTDAVDSYFAGPVNVNNAIGAAAYYSVGPLNIVNDCLQAIPVANHWLSYENTTGYINNLHAGRVTAYSKGDQILPLVGQTYMYFGYFLAPLFSIVSVYLVRWFDRKYKHDQSYLTFFYAFTGIWIGCTPMMLNMTICLAWFPIRIIPDYLILKYVNRFRY